MTNDQSPIPNPQPTNPLDPYTALDEIAQGLRALEAHLLTIQEQIADLEQTGVTKATPYWRKDQDSNPTILYLNHSSQNGQRKREYIGKDPAKQAAALARLEHWDQRQQLIQRANHLTTHLTQIHHDIRAIQIALTDLGEQCRTNELAHHKL